MRPARFTTVALVALACAIPLRAQQPAAPAPPPAANPADVSTLDSIMRAVYDVISGDSGVARNWDRMRSLFAPGARLIPTFRRRDGSGYGVRTLTVEEYIASATPFFQRQGFFEREVARRSERYGQIVHLFSTYESRHGPSDAQPFERGINSFQLYYDGTRWWIVTIFWEGESDAGTIPARYLVSEDH
ncbi:MAG: hypothetical protein HYR48_07750 [Gemmatimonadetes bacterium]|nr:hypothetical protein [Gemmatimonadota bacterium]